MEHSSLLSKARSKYRRLFRRDNWNLVVELVRANLRVIDHNSVFGVLWSFISPITMLIVMYAVFSTRFGQNIRAYPLYLLIGIVPVNFFITATSYSISIFFRHRHITLNTSVPREDILISNLYIHFYKFLLELALCMAISLFYGLLKPVFFLAVIPLIAAFLGLITGISFFFAIIHCFAKDVEHIWAIGSRLLLFITPVFYKLQYLSHWAAFLIYWCNPVTPFTLAFRGAFMGDLDIMNYMYCLFLGTVFFVTGYSFFIVFENISMERA